MFLDPYCIVINLLDKKRNIVLKVVIEIVNCLDVLVLKMSVAMLKC